MGTLVATGLIAGIVLLLCPKLISCQKLTHELAMGYCLSAGITLSSVGNCSNRNNPNCTSLEFVNTRTVLGIISLRRQSFCTVDIISGTETGQAEGAYSHWNGYKLDISLNACVNAFIASTFTFIGNRPEDGAPQYQTVEGDIYARESTRWDIVYF